MSIKLKVKKNGADIEVEDVAQAKEVLKILEKENSKR